MPRASARKEFACSTGAVPGTIAPGESVFRFGERTNVDGFDRPGPARERLSYMQRSDDLVFFRPAGLENSADRKFTTGDAH